MPAAERTGANDRPDSPWKTLPEELSAALARVGGTERLLVAMDFDGTLAPIVEHAADARALPESAAAMTGLATLPDTTTALISGRSLQSLRAVASPDDRTLLVGSHGAEVWAGPNRRPLTLTSGQAKLLERAGAILAEVADAFAGVRLEVKPAGVVLHTRSASDGDASAASAHARTRLDELARDRHLPALRVTDGKRVLECAVVDADKGEALTLLRDLTAATSTVFAGDDVTDEDAFAMLGPADVGIKVGPGPTRADHRVESPRSLPTVLSALLAERRAHRGR